MRPWELLKTHSFVVVRLPAEIIAAARIVERKMRAFFALPNAEKNQYRTPQEGERVLSHPGYLTPSPGWAELFEIRRSERDPAYKFPPQCEKACMRLFDLLREQSMHWLRVLSLHLCGDEYLLPNKMAVQDTGPATLRAIHYDQLVELAPQLAEIPKGDDETRLEAERKLMAGFPAHVDSSLLTLAMRANVSGLSVRDWSTGKYLRIERRMADDEAVLFAGDALSYISSHVLPACMHRPDSLEMIRQAPSTRLSNPFFLYPDEEALLDPKLCTFPHGDGGAAVCDLPPLSVRDFRLNIANVREEWPWKKTERYYLGRVICRDSDHFPGLEEEGRCPMQYAD